MAIGGVAYSLSVSRPWIEDRILLALDKNACHGYDLLRVLPEDAGRIQLTTLYRWLHDMESRGLIASEKQPGPHGPHRRVYTLGPRGEGRLRRVLKEAIEVVLHFYDAYRHQTSAGVYDSLDSLVEKTVEGDFLFTAHPRITMNELELIRFLARRCEGARLHIIGDNEVVKRANIKHRHLQGGIHDIPASNDAFAEVWVSGVPERQVLPRVVAECKRVLLPGGTMRITAPFVFFDEPEKPTLGDFIRVTSVHLFPDLGVVEGNDVGSVIESMFTTCGAFETFPGLVEFWAVKD